MESNTTSLARLGLRANAAFSLALGLVLAIAPSTVGDWLSVEIDGWLRLFGAVLVGHAVLLLWASLRADVGKWVRLNLLAIAPYPALMVVVVAAGLVDDGQWLVLADGAIVGSLAVIQYAGLRKMGTRKASLPAVL